MCGRPHAAHTSCSFRRCAAEARAPLPGDLLDCSEPASLVAYITPSPPAPGRAHAVDRPTRHPESSERALRISCSQEAAVVAWPTQTHVDDRPYSQSDQALVELEDGVTLLP